LATFAAPLPLCAGVAGVRDALAWPALVTSRKSWKVCPTSTAEGRRTADESCAGVWMVRAALCTAAVTTAPLFASVALPPSEKPTEAALCAETVQAKVTVLPPGTSAGCGEAATAVPAPSGEGGVGVNCSAAACPELVTSRNR